MRYKAFDDPRSRLLVLTRDQISDSESDISDTERTEEDDLGDAEVRQTAEEEELELVARV